MSVMLLPSLMTTHARAATLDEEGWRERVEGVVETLDVGPGTSVFDVGCGAGAFLLPLWENDYRVGGVDRDPALLDQARRAMPDGRFLEGEPSEVDPAESWAVVVASQGLVACATPDQVRGLLARMTAKASYAVALLGVRETAEPGGLVVERAQLLRALAELGIGAVQFETDPAGGFNVFAKV
jgi:trans-aconitate methyltransferase